MFDVIRYFWFSSQKVGDFIKVLRTKPWSLTLYGLRHVPAQPTIYIAKDKIKCAADILAVFYCNSNQPR